MKAHCGPSKFEPPKMGPKMTPIFGPFLKKSQIQFQMFATFETVWENPRPIKKRSGMREGERRVGRERKDGEIERSRDREIERQRDREIERER